MQIRPGSCDKKSEIRAVHLFVALTIAGTTRKWSRTGLHPPTATTNKVKSGKQGGCEVPEVRTDDILQGMAVLRWEPEPRIVFRYMVYMNESRWHSAYGGFGGMRWSSAAEEFEARNNDE